VNKEWVGSTPDLESLDQTLEYTHPAHKTYIMCESTTLSQKYIQFYFSHHVDGNYR